MTTEKMDLSTNIGILMWPVPFTSVWVSELGNFLLLSRKKLKNKQTKIAGITTSLSISTEYICKLKKILKQLLIKKNLYKKKNKKMKKKLANNMKRNQTTEALRWNFKFPLMLLVGE